MLAPWKKSYDQPRQHIKKQRHYFANKGLSIKAMVIIIIVTVLVDWSGEAVGQTKKQHEEGRQKWSCLDRKRLVVWGEKK